MRAADVRVHCAASSSKGTLRTPRMYNRSSSVGTVPAARKDSEATSALMVRQSEEEERDSHCHRVERFGQRGESGRRGATSRVEEAKWREEGREERGERRSEAMSQRR